MDFSQTILTIIISLISGFAGTIYLENKRKIVRKQKLSNYLVLLYSEIGSHSFWIKNLYSSRDAFQVCSKFLLEDPIKEWSNTKYFLAENLNSDDLQVLLIHYRNIDGFKRVFAKEPGYLLTESELDNFLTDSRLALNVLQKDIHVQKFVQSVTEKEIKEREAKK